MDRWWRFDRSDYRLLRGALGIAVLYAVAKLVLGLVAWVRGAALQWRSAVAGPPTPVSEQVSGGASGVWDGYGRWTIPHPSVGQRLGDLLPDVWGLVLVLLIAASLWRLVGSVERGQAFSDAAVRAIRTLGLVLLGAVVLGWVVNLVADQLVMMPLRAGRLLWAFELSDAELAVLLTALMVVALAEVWRQGRDAARDVAGLI